MIAVKVTYTVKPSFVARNLQNIQTFMQDFRKIDDFQYTVYTNENTFTHLSHYKNEEVQVAVLDTPSFKAFQEQRDASGLVSPPQIEVLTLAASAREVL
jgi:quinol monooxygenase YgiN